MIKYLSIKKQFVLCFILIISVSLMLSIITYGGYFMAMSKNLILPSNYYEKMVPGIIDYIEAQGTSVLNKANQQELETVIPKSGIEYIVLDNEYNPIYGDIEKISPNEKKSLEENESRYIHGQNISVFEFIKKDGEIKGVVLIRYSLKATAKNEKWNFLVPSDGVLLFSPFIYISICTWIFVRRFSRNINKPIDDLINAAKKIKNKDLDFHMEYEADNELGELTKAFEAMRDELQISLNTQWLIEQERSDMIAAIGHDLRTPLTVIKGHIEVLQESNLDNKERLHKYIDTIANNTNRAIKLIEDMNIISKLERIDFKLSPKDVHLENFVEEIKSNYEVICKKKNIKFSVDYINFNEEKSNIKIDVYRIGQVLDNIISNSNRFTPEGGFIKLKITNDIDELHFKIEDSGIGFSSKDKKRIFEKFYQGDESRSKEKGHFGLGMNIAKIIVEKHGGEIKVKNNDDGGACVEFYIKTQLL